jgi:hypothetical protein
MSAEARVGVGDELLGTLPLASEWPTELVTGTSVQDAADAQKQHTEAL